jgi:hypothetical protein
MKARTSGLLAVSLLAMSTWANATVIEGTFSGVVMQTSGTANGVDLSTLAGLTITGTFTFDSDALPLIVGGPGTGNSSFIANGSSDPVVISDSVGGMSYTVSGTVVSQLDIDTNIDDAHPDNYFRLAAQNVAGGPVLPGDVAGEIIVPLFNVEGAPFWSQNGDPSSVNFSNQNSDGELGQDTFTDVDGSGSGFFTFSITTASAWAVPEPTTLSLLGLGLAGVGFMRRHKVA